MPELAGDDVHSTSIGGPTIHTEIQPVGRGHVMYCHWLHLIVADALARTYLFPASQKSFVCSTKGKVTNALFSIFWGKKKDWSFNVHLVQQEDDGQLTT